MQLKSAIWAALQWGFPYSLFIFFRYLRNHGRLPNIVRPSTFTEKVLCKMMFDRNPLLPVIADKLAVRDVVRERVGSSILAEVYGVYDSADDIRLDELPDRFVLKANHGSKFNYSVGSAAAKNPEVIREEASKWLSTNYGRQRGEWLYSQIRPRLHAEELLDPDGDALIDYKIFCFDGEPQFVKVRIGLTGAAYSRYYDLDWHSFDVVEIQPNFPPDQISQPANWLEMLEVSRKLSAGFDFLRVDLYSNHGRIVFGELTNYPNGAAYKFEPLMYDMRFGSYWPRKSMTYLPFRL